MSQIGFGLGAAVLLVWIGLFAGWRGFWMLKAKLPAKKTAAEPEHWPCIVAVMVVTDGMQHANACFARLMAQSYPGDFRIVVVNSLANAEEHRVPDSAASRSSRGRVRIVNTLQADEGWNERTWLLSQGLAEADVAVPDYYWLTDGNTAHEPDMARTLASEATSGSHAIVSATPRPHPASIGEKLLLPVQVFCQAMLYRHGARRPGTGIHVEPGNMLVSRRHLTSIEGAVTFSSSPVLERDIAAAAADLDAPCWTGLASTSLTLSNATSDLQQIGRRVLTDRLSAPKSRRVLMRVLLTLGHLLPPLLTMTLIWQHSPAGYFGLAAWVIMVMVYLPPFEWCRVNAFWVLGLPVAAFLMAFSLRKPQEQPEPAATEGEDSTGK